MGLRDRGQWEVQWHPAGGGRIRRLVLTWRGARRLMLALGIAGLVAIAGGLLAGFDGVPTRLAVDAARRQNRALWVEQEDLREQASNLAERLSEDVERGRQMARWAGTPDGAWEGPCSPPPPRDAGDEAILAWLSEQGTQLEAIGDALAAHQVDLGQKQASVPAPVGKGATLPGHAAALQVAERESAGPLHAAPARP